MNGREEMTVGPVAALLETSKDTVRRMVDRGELPCRTTPGKQRLIPRWAAEAKKRELENAADPPDSGVAPNGDRPSTGNVERRVVPAEPAEAAPEGLTREEVYEIALESAGAILPPLCGQWAGGPPESYAWTPRPPHPAMHWTSLMAETARKEMLAWFETNYRPGWTWKEIWDLAHELIVDWAWQYVRRRTA